MSLAIDPAAQAVVPGADWGPVTRACSDLDEGLRQQDDRCAEVESLIGRLKAHESVAGEVFACLDAFASELERCAEERTGLQRLHDRLIVDNSTLAMRCSTLEEALDRASQFDRERADVLHHSEARRDQIQAKLRESAARVQTLQQTCDEQSVQINALTEQVRVLGADLDKAKEADSAGEESKRTAIQQQQVSAEKTTRLESALRTSLHGRDQIERENAHLKQEVSVTMQRSAATDCELAQVRRQLQQSDRLLATTQRSLEKAGCAKRKKEAAAADLAAKVDQQKQQIATLCSSLRQLRSFFHSVETMDSADPATTNTSSSRKPFQLRRIVKELDQLSISVKEGL